MANPTKSILSVKDTERLVFALQHCVQNPEGLKIDTEKFAQMCGLKDRKAGADAWYNLKKKLLASTSNGTSNSNGNTSSSGDEATNGAITNGTNGNGANHTEEGGKEGKECGDDDLSPPPPASPAKRKGRAMKKTDGSPPKRKRGVAAKKGKAGTDNAEADDGDYVDGKDA